MTDAFQQPSHLYRSKIFSRYLALTAGRNNAQPLNTNGVNDVGNVYIRIFQIVRQAMVRLFPCVKHLMQKRIPEIAIHEKRRLAGVKSKCSAQVQRDKAASSLAGNRGHHDDAVPALRFLYDLGSYFAEVAHRTVLSHFGMYQP